MEGFIPYTPRHDKTGFLLLLIEIQDHKVLARNGKRCRIVFYENGGTN